MRTVKASRKLDKAIKRGKNSKREIQEILKGLSASAPPVMSTRGGGFSLGRVSVVELLNGLYLPTEDPAFWVPAKRRYFDDEISTGAVGSASAYKTNGRLIATQNVDLNANQESTWAGVYIIFNTDIGNYGQVSRVTFEPEIDWTYSDTIDSKSVWLDRVAHLDGTIDFTARVWLAGYEFNIATGKFDHILPPSAMSYQVWKSTWHVTSLGSGAMSGSLRGGAATFKFIVSPARTYALGALIELRASHNLRTAEGGPIPKPGKGDFGSYALFKADVPEMWVQHEMLAK